MNATSHGPETTWMWICIAFVLPSLLCALDARQDYTYYVPYKLKNVTTQSILLSFWIKNVSFQLLMDEDRQFSNEPDIFIIGKNNSLKPFTAATDRACITYKGRDLSSSFSIQLCNGSIRKGVLVGNEEYFVMKYNKTNLNILNLHHQNSSISKNIIMKGMKLPGQKERVYSVRKKRQDFYKAHHVVELAIFTEHLLYDKYCKLYSPSDPINCTQGTIELSEYVNTVAIGAGLFYDHINNPELQVKLHLSAIIHNTRNHLAGTDKDESIFIGIEEEELDEYGNPQVDAVKALEKFALYQQRDLSIRPNIHADLSTIITIHGLVDEKVDGLTTIGIAYVDGVCDPLYKSALIQYKPLENGWHSVYILAHEIGHNLGATHDGRYEECPSDKNYIMSSYSLRKNVQNIFYFSCCSLAEMSMAIQRYGTCLTWVDPERIININENMPGVVFNRSEQCKTEFSNKHVPCYDATFDPDTGTSQEYYESFNNYVKERQDALGSNGCLAHWCVSPDLGECELKSRNPVLAGTWCAVGKWCIKGQCIDYGTFPDSSSTPVCNISKQQLTRKNDENGVFEQVEKGKQPLGIAELFGRYSSVVVGLLFFLVGITGTCFKKMRPRNHQNFERQHANVHNPNVNTNINNSSKAYIWWTMPRQYRRVLNINAEPAKHYDSQHYQKRIRKLTTQEKR